MATHLIFGDSITWGAWDTHGGWVSRIQNHVAAEVISSDYTIYHEVYNLGIPGDNTDKLLQRFEAEIKPRDDGSRLSITLAIGINDSQVYFETGELRVPFEKFQANLRQLVSIGQKHANKLFYIGLTPVDEAVVDKHLDTPEKTYRNQWVQKYNDAAKAICAEAGIDFIDIFDQWLAGDYQSLLVDGLHPNNDGHEKLFNTIYPTMQKAGMF